MYGMRHGTHVYICIYSIYLRTRVLMAVVVVDWTLCAIVR